MLGGHQLLDESVRLFDVSGRRRWDLGECVGDG